MSLRFIKPGLQTSIQDKGRFGQMHNGVSHSGAMDSGAMQMANWLVSKPLDSAVIEVTLIGPVIQFDSRMTIGVCGAQFDLYLNGNLVFNNESINVEVGDKLEFDHLHTGARAYLAFSGEPNIHPVLSSYSTHLTANFGGFQGRQFKKGDYLEIKKTGITKARKFPQASELFYSGNYLIRSVSSVESHLFSDKQKGDFFSSSYHVSIDSNRMGIRLSSALTLDKEIQIASSGLAQGSIQIPPSGDPIISCVDGQTIGGYPRIANVITADLPLLGQLKAKDKISFVSITNAEAHKILITKKNHLNTLFR